MRVKQRAYEIHLARQRDPPLADWQAEAEIDLKMCEFEATQPSDSEHKMEE